MKPFDLISNDNDENDVINAFEKRLEFVLSLSAQELLERIQYNFDSSDVIIEGYSLSDNLTTSDSIAYATIVRLREALNETSLWLKNEFKLHEYNDEDETDL
jgi:iron uptake system EfeUOB component EfeO/EfeM